MKALREENEGRMQEASFDLVDAQLRSKRNDPGAKALLTSLVLIHSLAHMKTTAATRILVATTDDHSGLFRAEITRHVKTLGELFVPALIEARRSPPDIKRWAGLQLESLGKKTAGDCAQVKSSQVLCDVLKAFGNIHDIEALAVILSFVNSDRAQVRQAAREALASYAGDGLWKLREAYQNLTGKPTPESWGADQVAKELFLAYDHVRLQDVYELMDKGLELAKQNKHESACEAFDRVLARQPLLDRKREMIGSYIVFASSIEESDSVKALALYRKAARLDPEPERRKQLEAAISFLEAKALSDRGVEDIELYRHVLTLDPSHTRARAEVERLAFDADAKKERTRRMIAGGVLLGVAALGALLLGARSTKRSKA
jgi:tetratricopeptide (TPR) repeat protein